MVSVVEKINEPRYPSFKGIMAAKKKPVETLGLADLGIDAGEAGLAASATEVVSFAKRPPRRPAHRDRRGRRRRQGRRVPRGPQVHLIRRLRGRLPTMAEILVLAEHDGETVKKVTSELLTLARGFGEPAVVWIGAGAEGGRARLAEFGAAKVYVADGPDYADYVVAPKAEVLAELVADKAPAAVLVAATSEGREVAGAAGGQDRLRRS